MHCSDAIPSRSSIPRGEFFDSFFDSSPLIIQQTCGSWPAVSHWSHDSFAADYGETLVWKEQFDPNSAQSSLEQTLNQEPQQCSIREFLQLGVNKFPLQTVREAREFFEQEQIVEELSNLKPFGRLERVDEEQALGLWFSFAGQTFPFQCIDSHLLLVQLSGKQTIKLFSPDEAKYLYLEDRTKIADDPRAETFDEEEVHDWMHHMRWSAVNPYSPDFTSFPLFKETSFLEGALMPGDLLYVPSAWWQAIETNADSIALTVELDEELFLRG